MEDPASRELVPVDPTVGLWERVFLVAPLVVVGTLEEDGRPNLAPKHLATPLSWGGHFGFVCTPRHATYRNAVRAGAFTVSYPRPDQVLLASLSAAPRCDDDSKPALEALATVPARAVEGVLLHDAYLHLECALDRVVDDLGENSLVAGRIVAARVAHDALRAMDRDDRDLLAECPLLAYVHPGRYASIDETLSFPFHAGFSR